MILTSRRVDIREQDVDLMSIVVMDGAKNGNIRAKKTGILCSMAHTITIDLLVCEFCLRI